MGAIVRTLIVMLTVCLLAPTVGCSDVAPWLTKSEAAPVRSSRQLRRTGDCVVDSLVEVVEATRGRRTRVAPAW